MQAPCSMVFSMDSVTSSCEGSGFAPLWTRMMSEGFGLAEVSSDFSPFSRDFCRVSPPRIIFLTLLKLYFFTTSSIAFLLLLLTTIVIELISG